MMLSPLLLCLFAAAPQGAPEAQPPQQETKPKLTDEQLLEQHLRFARTGSLRIRPQAARKLLRLGDPAAKRLLAVSGDTTAKLALLGTDLIEILGRFGNDELRAKLWPAMDDAEFPWRPAAARSLAEDPKPEERARFEAFLDDPIAPVRLAVLDALFRLSVDPDPTLPMDKKARAALDAQQLEFLRLAAQQLHDENDQVRRRAAILLDARGHGRALLWLLEDLKRTDAFFDRPSGMMARYASQEMLRERGLDLATYRPELTSVANAASLDAIEKAIRARAAKRAKTLPEVERNLVPEAVPPIAQASPPVDGAVLGVELKSCRRGDFYLRWTADDQLIIGDGNPARLQLPEGTTEKLMTAALDAQRETGESVLWGRPGCDTENYRLPSPDPETPGTRMLLVSKNEVPAPDLRPGALTALGRSLLMSLPEEVPGEAEDPRLTRLRERVRGAFASIGGPLKKKDPR